MTTAERRLKISTLLLLIGLFAIGAGCRSTGGGSGRNWQLWPARGESRGCRLFRRSQPAMPMSPIAPMMPSMDMYAPLAPGQNVEWSIESLGDTQQPKMMGQAVVGPDGRIILGPYGEHKISGLSVQQAAARLERDLQTQVKKPRVHLQPVKTSEQPKLLETTPAMRWDEKTWTSVPVVEPLSPAGFEKPGEAAATHETKLPRRNWNRDSGAYWEEPKPAPASTESKDAEKAPARARWFQRWRKK